MRWRPSSSGIAARSWPAGRRRSGPPRRIGLDRRTSAVCGRSRARAGSPAPRQRVRCAIPSRCRSPAERCAVVLGTRFASIEPLVEFDRDSGDGRPCARQSVELSERRRQLARGLPRHPVRPRRPERHASAAQTAGLEALDLALDLLELGRADAVLAGGVEALGETLVEGLRRTGVDELGRGRRVRPPRPGRAGHRRERRARRGPDATADRTWSAADVRPRTAARRPGRSRPCSRSRRRRPGRGRSSSATAPRRCSRAGSSCRTRGRCSG